MPVHAKTETPGAKRIVGRNHFFELPEASLSKDFAELSEKFTKTIKAVDELMLSTAPTPGGQ